VTQVVLAGDQFPLKEFEQLRVGRRIAWTQVVHLIDDSRPNGHAHVGLAMSRANQGFCGAVSQSAKRARAWQPCEAFALTGDPLATEPDCAYVPAMMSKNRPLVSHVATVLKSLLTPFPLPLTARPARLRRAAAAAAEPNHAIEQCLQMRAVPNSNYSRVNHRNLCKLCKS
jgi:hypothetical protein